jgi:hypothetical protein
MPEKMHSFNFSLGGGASVDFFGFDSNGAMDYVV